jgi:hypothetical protein
MSEEQLKDLQADADQEIKASSEIYGEEISDEEISLEDLAGVAGGTSRQDSCGSPENLQADRLMWLD